MHEPPERSVGSPRIALLVPSLAGGGVERNTLALARGFLARGFGVDLLLYRVEGPLAAEVPAGVRIIELPHLAPIWRARLLALRADPGGLRELLLPVLLARRPPASYRALPPLVRYLRDERPAGLVSAFPFENLIALAARRLAGVATRVVVTERNTTTASTLRGAKWKRRHLPALLRRSYAEADAIVAVSEGVAENLARVTGLPREAIAAVHNPVVGADLANRAAEPVDHPWFAEDRGPPVVLGVGRLVAQKDFPTLIRAFSRLRRQRPARLVILGEGTSRAREELSALARGLGCGDDVDLPGFAPNPFAYMARADVFALSSLHEGLPAVLVQALACGCPVVSTDCPSGPAEILDGGRYGPLVPVGDDAALAAALAAALDDPSGREARMARAADFGAEQAVARYLSLLGLAEAGGPAHGATTAAAAPAAAA